MLTQTATASALGIASLCLSPYRELGLQATRPPCGKDLGLPET